MEYLLIGGVFGAWIGFALGVLAMAVFGAAGADTLPTPPACAYPEGGCLATRESAKPAP